MKRLAIPRAKKRLGQNFLIDDYVVAQIIQLIKPQHTDHIIEIGPGTGALTDLLVRTKAVITAIEVDRDLARSLVEHYADIPTFKLHNSDIMNFDLEILRERSTAWKIIGNLPYNIATPLIMNLVTLRSLWSEMIFMLQKEVALRLTAKAGARSYGRLSIMAQRQAHISYKFEVSAASFSPQPKVQSAVVRFQPINNTKNPEIDVYFEKIVRLAFATRRKTLTNSLKSLIPSDVIKQAEIDPKSRAEDLTITEYERLALKTLELLRH